jgi:predicted metal-dependent hydrolase
VPDRVTYFAKQLGLSPGKITIKDMAYRWASCGKNNSLQFNWRIMMAPITIIDYVIVHELCHFKYKNHNDAFWNEIDKVMPDYPERKEWLKNNGASLEI